MIDKRKVIYGLEIQLDDLQKYADNDQPITLAQEQAQEIISLLKEQEPKPPIVHENSYGWKFYYCPNCEKEFYQNRKQAYCEKCGQAVKWE